MCWWVNDATADENRHLLLDLIPRLMQTGKPVNDQNYMNVYQEVSGNFFMAVHITGKDDGAGRMNVPLEITELGIFGIKALIEAYWEARGVPEPEPSGLTADDYTLMRETVTQ